MKYVSKKIIFTFLHLSHFLYYFCKKLKGVNLVKITLMLTYLN